MENRFNLIDEPWIPIADAGRVSLSQIFSTSDYRSLGGNPVQKIAVTKLLLAICQAACKPKDEDDWRKLKPEGVANHCLEYLEKWREKFYLYGEHPFLQMPAISKAKLQDYGAVMPQISTGNTTVLIQGQIQRSLNDADKAVLLVELMGFALSGKKTDNSIALSPEYQGKRNNKGKPSSSKPGPSVGHMGLQHSFFLGCNLHETLWLNLFTKEQVKQNNSFAQGIGVPPWEKMPSGEDCPIAKNLKETLIGRLIPLCRFCLLTEGGLHYSEGIAHSNYKEGMCDPTVAVNYSGKDPKALWVNPEKRPWRELTSLLSFMEKQGEGFHSWQIATGLLRAREETKTFGIWAGGLRVSANAGEQYASGTDDFVESLVWLDSALLGKDWFLQLKIEMNALDDLAKALYGRVVGFFKEQNVDPKKGGSKIAAQATHHFWQFCERDFQELVNVSASQEEGRKLRRKIRLRLASYARQSYDHFCPKDTARQIEAWAKNQLNTHKYLKEEA